MPTFAAGLPAAGRYLLVERLHASPRVEIWSAFDDILGRPVAIKFYRRAAGDPAARARVHARARRVGRLHHPHLVPVHDVGDVPMDGWDIPFVVMRLVEGEPWTAVRRPWAEAADQLGQLAAALDLLHRNDLAHGAIDGGSVLVTADGPLLGGLVPAPGRATDPTPDGDVHDLAQLAWTVLTGSAAPADAAARRLQLTELAAGADIRALLAALDDDPQVRPRAFALMPPTASTIAVTLPRRARSRRAKTLVPAGVAAVLVATFFAGGTVPQITTALANGVAPAEPSRAPQPDTVVPTQPSPTAGAPSQGAAPSPQGQGGSGTEHPIGGGDHGASPTPGAAPTTEPTRSPAPATPRPSAQPTQPSAFDTALTRFRDDVAAGIALGGITVGTGNGLIAAANELASNPSAKHGWAASQTNKVDAGERSGHISDNFADLLRADIAAIDAV